MSGVYGPPPRDRIMLQEQEREQLAHLQDHVCLVWLSCTESLKPCSEEYKESFTNPTIFSMIVRLLVGALDGEAAWTHPATYSFCWHGCFFVCTLTSSCVARSARTSSRSRLAHACWCLVLGRGTGKTLVGQDVLFLLRNLVSAVAL